MPTLVFLGWVIAFVYGYSKGELKTAVLFGCIALLFMAIVGFGIHSLSVFA